MKVKSILAMAFVALLAVGCDDDDNQINNNSTSEGVSTIEISTKDYSVWTYLNVKTGETTTATVPGPWKYISENGVREQDPEIKGSVPAEWDLAFHYYEIRTNGYEAAMVDASKLSDVISLPTTGFTKDVEVKAEDEVIITDMSKMMKGEVGYASGSHNPVLYNWVTRTETGSMPPILYAVNKDKVFVVRMKDGNWVKLQFSDCLDGNGKKAVKFSYEYMSK